MWQIIYRAVLFPIFEDVRRDEAAELAAAGKSVAEPLEASVMSTLPPLGAPRRSINPAIPQQSAQPTVQTAKPSQPPPPSTPPPSHRASSSVSMSPGGDDGSDAWLRTTCHAALSSLIELFSHSYATVNFMLPEVLNLVCSCVMQVLRSSRHFLLFSPFCFGFCEAECG